ncbi:MAG: DUF5946 family protein [Acidobacteriaceae bacterium]
MPRIATEPQPDQALFDELSFYTLAQPRSEFIHQLAIDTFTAQHAIAATPPIAIVFAVLGLYLHAERGFTGLQIQRVHMQLAPLRLPWPVLQLPARHADLTVADVLAAAPGPDRNATIRRWCAAEWQVWGDSRTAIAHLLKTHLDID